MKNTLMEERKRGLQSGAAELPVGVRHVRDEEQMTEKGVEKKRRSEDEGSERQLFTDKRADTWLQSAGRWVEAKSAVSSRDGAACHSLSRATRTPGSRKLHLVFSH